ncbi:MAG: carboxypeptidase regulatory-like domain-containing protein, partial [Terracidiphilus sp.]
PFGKTVLADKNLERAILGGFKFSGIYQAYSGSPLAITESSAQTNQAESSTAPAILNPNFSGKVRQNGKKWGKGVSTNPGDPNYYTNVSFITPSTGTTTANAAGPFMNPVSTILSSYAYQFSDAPRTAPYGLVGPGNYQLDLAMVRSFPLHITKTSKFDFRAEWYNVTNHTQFSVASTAVGNASFGQVTSNGIANRKAAQFSGRIEF